MQDIEYGECSEYSNNDEEKMYVKMRSEHVFISDFILYFYVFLFLILYCFKPKSGNFTSVLSKHSTSTHPPTFPSITNHIKSSNTHQSSNTHTHTNTQHTNNSNRNSNYNDDFEKEYYFHHQINQTLYI